MASISAQSELAQFIVECLLRLDPSLNTAEGGRVYTTVVTPLLNRLGADPLVVDIETFIQQRLLDVYPELDINTPGSAIRDILVTPLVLLLTPLRTEIAHLRRQQSLADYETLTENEMDALLANVLASRDTGSFAYGVARTFFSSARVVGIDSSISFTTPLGVKFVADEVRTYLSSELTRQGNQWYLDVPIRSGTPNSSANIAANTQLTVSGVDSVVRCYNPTSISGGYAQATNADFYARAQEAMTEQSLNTSRGINAFISSNTTGVVSVDVVGFGDPLMQRDILTSTGNPITISGIPGGVPFPGVTGTTLSVNANQVHVGGATDIYIKTGQPAADAVADLVVTDDLLEETDVQTCSITGGSTTVTCTGLGALLGFSGAVVPVTDTVLEFENFVGITPVAVRVIAALTADTVRIETAFSGFAGVLVNQRARLVSTSRLDLVAPKIILQQGELTTVASSKTVQIDTVGVFFNNDPATEAVYLEIIFGGRPVEYRVLGKAAAELMLDRVPESVDTGLTFRAYLKQTGSVSLPLLQTTRMFLADGDEGINIPYKEPVRTVVSTSAGKRSTALTFADLGACSIAGTAFTCTAPYSFNTVGVLAGDILVIPEATPMYYVVSVVASATSLTLVSAGPAGPLSSVGYRIGSVSYSRAQLTFLLPTYLEVTTATTRFTYTDDSGVDHIFKPNQLEAGYIYNPTELYSTFVVNGTGTGVVQTTDILTLGAKGGDVLEIQYLVLKSAAITDVDELVLPLGSDQLTVHVDGVEKTVVFPVTATMTLDEAATYINQKLGADLFAERQDEGVDAKYLRIYSRKHIVLANKAGAPLTALQLTMLDNAFPTMPTPGTVIGTISASGLVAAISGVAHASTYNQGVMVAIKRTGTQFVFPANMTALDNGMYTADIAVESITPYDKGAIPDNSDFVPTYYRTMGHSFVVDNSAYSFSTGERVSVAVTPLLLPATATSMETALTTPRALLTIEYEHAPEVDSLQSAFLRPSNRVTCNSPLVRHHFPAYPVVGIRYSGTAVEADVEAALLEFFVRLYPNLPLEAYDVMATLSKLDVEDVEGPIEVGYLTIDADRAISLRSSMNRVDLDRSFHVMGELDYVTTAKG